MTISQGVADPPAIEPRDSIEVHCEAEGCGRAINAHNPVDLWCWLNRRWCARCIDRLLDSMMERAI